MTGLGRDARDNGEHAMEAKEINSRALLNQITGRTHVTKDYRAYKLIL